MNAKTRRAALEAASRVALGALSMSTLASCGGKTVNGGELDTGPAAVGSHTPPQSNAGTPPQSNAGTPPPTAQAPRPMDAGALPPAAPEDAGSTLACVGPVTLNSNGPEPPAISDAAFECCLTYVLRYGGDDGTKAYSNCCAAVIVGVDQDSTRWQQGFSVWNACCGSTDPTRQSEVLGHSLCSPWGPPVPPRLPPELGGVA